VEIAAAKNGSIVQFHHPRHGWLSFLLPPDWANQLGLALIKQAALIEYFNGAAPPPNEAVN
jgi:hypothetical protein